jgi:hypothetical protein
MRIDRREFLRKAGLGSLALASLPKLADTLASPAWAQGQASVDFYAASAAGPAGTPVSPQHRILMGGQCRFDPRAGAEVAGGGTYTHFLFPGGNPPPGGTPLSIVASGVWKSRLLVSYKEIGMWGFSAAGVFEMVIDLFRETPSKAVIRGARLKYVCNIGPAGLVNPGEPEGYTLSIPGTDFFTGGNPGAFEPLVPPLGLTSGFQNPYPLGRGGCMLKFICGNSALYACDHTRFCPAVRRLHP